VLAVGPGLEDGEGVEDLGLVVGDDLAEVVDVDLAQHCYLYSISFISTVEWRRSGSEGTFDRFGGNGRARLNPKGEMTSFIYN
jgi:hypothetical protein